MFSLRKLKGPKENIQKYTEMQEFHFWHAFLQQYIFLYAFRNTLKFDGEDKKSCHR